MGGDGTDAMISMQAKSLAVDTPYCQPGTDAMPHYSQRMAAGWYPGWTELRVARTNRTAVTERADRLSEHRLCHIHGGAAYEALIQRHRFRQEETGHPSLDGPRFKELRELNSSADE